MIYYVTVRKLTMDFFRAVPTDTYIYMLQKRIRNKPCRLTHDLNHENAPAKFSNISLMHSKSWMRRRNGLLCVIKHSILVLKILRK